MTDTVAAAFASRTVAQDALQMLDHALPLVLIFKLSAAWLYPSFITSDTAAGLPLVNALFLAFCLYGTIRLLFTRAIALPFAEPAYLALLAWAAVTIPISVSPTNSLGMVRTAILFFCACVFIRYRFTPIHILRLFAITMGVLLATSALAALALPLGTMGGFDAGRWRGVFNHKNTLGETASVTLIVALGLWVAQPRRLWLPPIIALAALCMAMAGSATALAIVAVALSVCGLTWLIVRLNIVRNQGFWLLLTLLIVFLCAAFAAIGAATLYLGRDLTFTGRTEIWAQFLYFASQRPWTGWGWAIISTSDAMLPIIRQTLDLPHIQTPHNGFLSALVELGYPGLTIMIIWLLTTVLWTAHTAVRHKNPVALIRLGLACGLIVHSLFESTSGILPSLWLFLLLCTNARVMIRW